MERKKLFKMFAVLAFVMLGMMLASCGGSDDDESGVSLAGKTYAAYAYKFSDGSDAYEVIRFISDTRYEYTTRVGSPNGVIVKSYPDIETGTYSIAYPKIVFSAETGFSKGVTYNATFLDNDHFRLTSGDRTMEFGKQ